ncbi:MAG: UDP-2,3-diacylglucosamine pyrophosphatase LpxH [Candidatus Latescibacterota bacterium]|jgi:UDP-2,3-diacylglucosamine pyrophosphatase LpxH
MSEESFFIVSDLHLGSSYFHQGVFLAWLDQLPVRATLILNGDVIDEPKCVLPPEHSLVLERLIAESKRRLVVWVYGNHDADFHIEDAGEIQFVHSWEIGKRLFVVHGNNLDDVMPRYGIFKWLFRRLHRLCVRLGFGDVHVAEYAKKWSLLYRVLNERVARNALRTAEQLGFAAITCGHTHAAMDIQRGEQRYLNTGAWTERPLHYIWVGEKEIELRVYEGDSVE